jgi:hypothetical protein
MPHAVRCVLQCRMHGACCDVLHRIATRCNVLRRVAPGCNGLHGCAVSVSVGHIRSVTVHVDWPTRSVAVEISGACPDAAGLCRSPRPRRDRHGAPYATSASGLRRPLPHQNRDLPRPCSIVIRRARALVFSNLVLTHTHTRARIQLQARMMFRPHKRRHALWASTHSHPQRSGYSARSRPRTHLCAQMCAPRLCHLCRCAGALEVRPLSIQSCRSQLGLYRA